MDELINGPFYYFFDGVFCGHFDDHFDDLLDGFYDYFLGDFLDDFLRNDNFLDDFLDNFFCNLLDGLIALLWELFEKSWGLFSSGLFKLIEVWNGVPFVLRGDKYSIVFI